MKTIWHKIPSELGHALWQVLRAELGAREERTIGVHETFSDPTGQYGRPTMMTVVGAASPILRLETRWTKEDRSDAVTEHWLPEFIEEDST